MKFWPIIIAGQSSAAILLTAVIVTFDIQPLISVRWSFGSTILAAIAGVLISDFVFYWYHRAQHKWLWRQHSVHHSIENLTAINSYHHWTEPFVYALGIHLPLVFIDIRATPQLYYLTMLFAAWPYFIHSSALISIGPLSRIMIDNRFHRIHHSTEQRHFDTNFGAVTTLWDHVFRTAYVPEKNEWPQTGLIDQPEPLTYAQWSSAVFERPSNANSTAEHPV